MPAGAAASVRALLRIGEILGAHGLRGEVRLRSFAADPAEIVSYSPLLAEDGKRSFAVTALRPAGRAPDLFVACLSGVTSRGAAEALAGTPLYVARERLLAGLGEEEFLHADLIGCRVETEGGKHVGAVVAVQNFGAGDLIEVALAGSRRTELLPFAARFVPRIDLAARLVVVSADPDV